MKNFYSASENEYRFVFQHSIENRDSTDIQKDSINIRALSSKEMLEGVNNELKNLKKESLTESNLLGILKSHRIQVLSEFENRIKALDKKINEDLTGAIPAGDFLKFLEKDPEYKTALLYFLSNEPTFSFDQLKDFYEKSITRLEIFVKKYKKIEKPKESLGKVIEKGAANHIADMVQILFKKINITKAAAINAKVNPFSLSLFKLMQKKVKSANKEIKDVTKDIAEMKKNIASNKYKMSPEATDVLYRLYLNFHKMGDEKSGLKNEMKKYFSPKEMESNEIKKLLEMLNKTISDLEFILKKSGKGDLVK